MTAKEGRGGRRNLPYVFTEQGVAMLSSVLKSNKAIEVNIAIMRPFVRIRELALTNKVILRKLDALAKLADWQSVNNENNIHKYKLKVV